jgi:hypothetical protein
MFQPRAPNIRSTITKPTATKRNRTNRGLGTRLVHLEGDLLLMLKILRIALEFETEGLYILGLRHVDDAVVFLLGIIQTLLGVDGSRSDQSLRRPRWPVAPDRSG